MRELDVNPSLTPKFRDLFSHFLTKASESGVFRIVLGFSRDGSRSVGSEKKWQPETALGSLVHRESRI